MHTRYSIKVQSVCYNHNLSLFIDYGKKKELIGQSETYYKVISQRKTRIFLN